ncbi:MAG: TetR/AcrR family transcriptional regulator [Myxococcota bacterium]|nr:TetR/AcrR family transcriptional regulator [Deltaproteobacteria bacterium]MDQ3338668.1 TetR/AcrR family transcriptional regulator [Myxococcota bacterium]
MSLFEEHKAERRERIISAARELVTKHGYEGLTMRDLAAAARVSVPTLYNLFGSKDAILVAELGRTAVVIASRIQQHGTFFARGMAAFEAGMDQIEEQPAFFRAVMHMFLTSPESGDMRRRSEEGYIAIMTANLRAAEQAGQFAEWAEPEVVARHMYGLYVSIFLAWAADELDMKGFRNAALSGICHLLVGVTLGAFHDEALARLRKLYKESPHHKPKEVRRHAAKSRAGSDD